MGINPIVKALAMQAEASLACVIVGSGKSNTEKIVNNLGSGNYAARLCYDLEPEYQWLPFANGREYAAKGGKLSKDYKYSGSDMVGDVAWYSDNSGNKTYPVKSTSSPTSMSSLPP